MAKVEQILLVAGTFLPLIGILATALLAIVLQKWWRLAALVLVPVLFFGLSNYYAPQVGANGNMLFVAIFGVYMVVLAIYYPALLIAAVILWLRRDRVDAS